MKPPHTNRPGGSSRPPSDRGPYRGPAGHAPRSPGQGSGGPNGGGKRADARTGYTPKAGDTVHRDHPKPRHDGPRPGGPRQDGPRHDGPRPGGPRQDGPRQDGPRPGGKPYARSEFQPRPPKDGAPRGDFQPRPQRDGAPQRLSAPPQRHREPDAGRATPDAPKGTVWLYGHHAVAAALANPNRRLRRLLLTDEGEAAIGKHLPPPWAVSPERVDRGRLDTLLGRDIAHQGAALLADPLAPPSLQSVLEKPGVIIVLDQVTDPRNVGAIMRSAAAFGAAAVITQDRNAPEETGGLAKAASGALEKMPLLRAVNIARTIIALKAANVWCIGLDAGGKALSGPAFADRRVALVLGAEGEGLRRLTRETCDEIAGLTIKGVVESLNVSAAASVALYELARR
jgi:23S rRNA (guanosine2251-2'-O)-methyltransferase